MWQSDAQAGLGDAVTTLCGQVSCGNLAGQGNIAFFQGAMEALGINRKSHNTGASD